MTTKLGLIAAAIISIVLAGDSARKVIAPQTQAHEVGQ